ncbi:MULTISPECIES: hypothetical protein [Virgibacillus]|uniref:Uncharacterized protein n=1 Tax=Virgibacillus salarius TaxID=447199 RepID=A0A941E0X1_9BACI|nr:MULTISPECIES: hypothetical protein [Bacillaceae]MBR7797728.1 hypothetical protein [Virgibacillus salarius]WBX80541.1 hypothetical protein PD280_01335 [Virgibacillus salarius]
MWHNLVNNLPSFKTYIYMAFAFLVPFAIAKMNMKFHKLGDPPWKKKDDASNYEKE